MSEPVKTVQEETPDGGQSPKEQLKLYHVQFRAGLQPKAASSKLPDLVKGEGVMVQTDHGPEPAYVCGGGIELTPIDLRKPLELLPILRRANNEEINRYLNLMQREEEAKRYCQERIHDLGLGMKLLQVERYFNGSKVIFYFSAEMRVDFRDLVKALVQEFRTRVEMRQIGVRHETQMLGGIGCCGRELCCGLFMKDFVPVSIKMAKEQDLPLNPAKISGVCNRLLCCLTHEYETYKGLKKGMPKVGRQITFEDRQYKVTSCKALSGTITVTSIDDARESRVLSREEWEKGVSVAKGKMEPEERQQPPAKPSTPLPGGPRQPGKPSAGKPQAAETPSGPGKQQPARGGKPSGQRPAPHKPQGGAKPAPPKVEAGKPTEAKPSRSRRSRGRKKGKTP